MFSGIVEEIGTIKEITARVGSIEFSIQAQHILNDLTVGASIAVNGVCLTVTEFNSTEFKVEAVPETLRLTNLKELKVNSLINLERSVTANTRIGGHFVQGHIDGLSKILAIMPDGDASIVKFSVPKELAHYVVKKGFITLDGMSITVIDVGNDWFSVTFIPHTQAVTIVKDYQVGKLINLEVDILGKYVERILEKRYEQ